MTIQLIKSEKKITAQEGDLSIDYPLTTSDDEAKAHFAAVLAGQKKAEDAAAENGNSKELQIKVDDLSAACEGLSAELDRVKAKNEGLIVCIDASKAQHDKLQGEYDTAVEVAAETDKAQKDLALIKAENFTLKAEVAEKNDAIEKLKAGKAAAKPKKTA